MNGVLDWYGKEVNCMEVFVTFLVAVTFSA